MEIVSWIDPKQCDPPHIITHEDKYIDLVRQFCISGWDCSKPVLIGYYLENKIQLISGSHRWAAAKTVNIKIPVVVHTYEQIRNMWGTDEWLNLLENANSIEYTNEIYI